MLGVFLSLASVAAGTPSTLRSTNEDEVRGVALLAITLGATCLAGCSNDDDAAVTSTQTTSKTATVTSTVEKRPR
ncbi:MAG: hypothetical protein U1U88_001433 [Lawsonella clevelandensis]